MADLKEKLLSNIQEEQDEEEPELGGEDSDE